MRNCWLIYLSSICQVTSVKVFHLKRTSFLTLLPQSVSGERHVTHILCSVFKNVVRLDFLLYCLSPTGDDITVVDKNTIHLLFPHHYISNFLFKSSVCKKTSHISDSPVLFIPVSVGFLSLVFHRLASVSEALFSQSVCFMKKAPLDFYASP